MSLSAIPRASKWPWMRAKYATTVSAVKPISAQRVTRRNHRSPGWGWYRATVSAT